MPSSFSKVWYCPRSSHDPGAAVSAGSRRFPLAGLLALATVGAPN